MSESVVEREVRDMEAIYRDVHLRGDAEGLARLDADNIMSINSEGEVRGKDWLIEAYRTGAVKDEAMESDDMQIWVYSNVAVVTMRTALKRHYQDRIVAGRFRITRVWVKQNGGWKIIVTHSTKIVE
jgi:hypothetical protein